MSNLLKDASILLTPTAYENGRMNAIKPYKDLYGPELVTNGDFATDSDWIKGNGTIISGGKANLNGSLSGSFQDPLRQSSVLTVGKKYKVTFTISDYVSGAVVVFGNGSTEVSANGTYTQYITATITNLSFQNRATPITCSIDNVSVKEDLSGDFTFSRNSAATRVNAQGLVENVQIISPELVSNGNFSQIGTEEVSNGNFSQEGSELITNGDFATDSDWVITSSVTIENGKANFNNTPAYEFALRQLPISGVTIGKIYKVSFDLTVESGNIAAYLTDPPSISDILTESGTYTYYFKATSTQLRFRAIDLGFTGSIDNVSVKEVGQDWNLGNKWSIGENSAIRVPNSTSNLSQVISGISGKTIKVSYAVSNYVSGDIGASADGNNYNANNGNGTFVEYITPTSDNFYLRASYSFEGSITNISVKEVGQDWTFGTGWSVDQANSKAVSDTTASNLTPSTTLISGRKYKFSLNSEAVSSGSYSFLLRFNSTNTTVGTVNSDGSHEFVAIADSTSFRLQTLSGGSTNFSITNISVKEITDDTDLPRINYEGFSYQDSLGSEEVVNGDFSNGSANWVNVGNAAVFENSGVIFENNARIYQNVVSDLSKEYNIEIEFSSISGNGIQLLVGNGNSFVSYSVSDIINNGNKINIAKESFIGTGLLFIYSQDSSTSATITSVSVKEYLGQEVVPDSGCGSWLLEGQSTNLIKYSEDFSNSDWTKSKSTITSNSVISPDGTQNASLVVGDDTSTSTYIRAGGVNTVVGNTYSYSLYVKPKGNSRYLKFWARNTDASFVVFDLDNGTTDSPTTSAITDAGNGWWRVSSFGELLSSTVLCYVYPYYTATESDGFYIWGAQLEESSISSSYIPTNGASSTRLQDIADNSGNSTLINSTEGVLYAEIAALADDLTNRFISLTDTTANNSVSLFYGGGSSNFIRCEIKSNNITQAELTTTNFQITNYNKVAIKYKENDFALWVNGTEVSTNTSGSVPIGLSDLSFDRANILNFHGKNKALAVYKEALTDSNLRCLTYPNPVATTFDLDFDTIAEQFTFTRGSEATFVNEQGLIESTNQIGPELITNGDFATDSDWNKGTGITISNDVALFTSVSSGLQLSQSGTEGVVGKTYKITYEIKSISQGAFSASIGTTLSNNQNNQVGVYTEYLTATGTGIFYIRSRGTTTGSIDNVSVKEVTTATNTPRIDYSTGEKAFLLEPQGTNLITYSEDFSEWPGGESAVIANQLTSPSGEMTAYKLNALNATNQQYIKLTPTVSSGSTYTFSVFAKAQEVDYIALVGLNPFTTSYFDLNNGTALSNSAISSSIEDFGNGWYRCTSTFTADTTSKFSGIYLSKNGTSITNGTSISNGEGVYIWGAQLEQQSYATSYIPTSGASATRNQELCNNATPVINSEEGTLYAEISALADDTTNKRISLSYDGANYVRIALTNSEIRFAVFNNGAYQVNGNYPVSNITDFNKIAFKYKENDFALWVNGTEVRTDTSGLTSFAAPLDHLNFSNGDGTNQFFKGNTKGLKYYPKALADVQLEDLTTI